jgi:2'-5' RNA ligase
MITSLTKQSSSFHWNSYGMMEYLLVLQPGESVFKKIDTEKKEFCQLYGEKTAVRTEPHIGIAIFLGKEGMEDTLNRWITKICNQHQRFELSLNNFSGFPPDTIYIRIQDPLPIYSLVQQFNILDDYIRSSDCPPLKYLSKPHLPLAKKLSLDVYDKALKAYAQKDFHESFTVDELVLLKRSHQFETSTVVNKFRFAQKS